MMALGAAALAAMAVTAAGAQNAGVPAAKVNGTVISEARLQSGLDAYMRQRKIGAGGVFNPDFYKQMKRQVLDVLISQELLWQEASERGLVATDETVEAALARIRERYQTEGELLSKIREGGFDLETFSVDLKHRLSVQRLVVEVIAPDVAVSDEEVHAFYLANRERFSQPEQVHARHILIKVATDADDATRQAARERIEAIAVEAQGGADFAELATQHSEGPTAAKGGDLGVFGRGQMVKPFEQVAFTLEPGAVSEPVETVFGYHVIKVEARRGGGEMSEEAAAPQIRNHLGRTKVQEAVEAYVMALREQAEVEVIAEL
jgi:parvulin-like peptidyl-prolyl isomerase